MLQRVNSIRPHHKTRPEFAICKIPVAFYQVEPSRCCPANTAPQCNCIAYDGWLRSPSRVVSHRAACQATDRDGSSLDELVRRHQMVDQYKAGAARDSLKMSGRDATGPPSFEARQRGEHLRMTAMHPRPRRGLLSCHETGLITTKPARHAKYQERALAAPTPNTRSRNRSRTGARPSRRPSASCW
jgi:hypothetical protein